MIVIIEGCDLVGKSTLAKALADQHGWPIVKIRWALRGDPEIETRAMATTTIALLQATRPNVIFDRIYFSWWAYAPALGHDASYMPEIIGQFSAVEDAKLVLLTASETEIQQRFEQKPDLYFPLDMILSANARFSSLLPLLPANLPYLHIDTSLHSANEVVEQVNAFLQP